MTQALLVMLAAVNPVVAAASLASLPAGPPGDGGGARSRLLAVFVACDVAAALAVLLAWWSDPILDGLDVSPPTFRIGTAVVLGITGLLAFLRGARAIPDVDPDDSPDDRPGDELLPAEGRWRGVVVPALVPVLVTPALVTAGIAMGADHGVGPVVLAAVVVLAATTALATLPGGAGVSRPVRVVWSAGGRLVGVLAIVMALALAVDGVKSV